MGGIMIFVAWITISVWATLFIIRRDLPRAPHRFLFYALIWFVPFFGAAIAIVISGLGAERIESSSDEEMFQSVIEKHRSMRDD